ncbi:MAG: RagB/SusD family nutrient uptake outer membrane protein [Dehalococcoidia bacterium]
MSNLRSAALALALTVPMVACGDFFDVENPGMIEDQALNELQAVPGLVGGMSGDYSVALGLQAWGAAMMAGELSYGGAWEFHALPAAGEMTPEFSDMFYWPQMHRARWVAESGIERLQEILGSEYSESPHAARANLLAGLSNRLLGETVCHAVIDGGPAEDRTVHFTRAAGYFSEAAAIAEAAGAEQVRQAALLGRATVQAWLGNWTDAETDAAAIPVEFAYEANFSSSTGRETNLVVEETVVRFESTVWGTEWSEVEDDPRVPWEVMYDAGGAVRTARDGHTPVYMQLKYADLGSNIPVAKGTEALLLRAEAALRDSDVETSIGFINDARAHVGLEELNADTPEEAWEILQSERQAFLWLEGRTLWDLNRWHEEGRHSFLDGRDGCIPIGSSEIRTNPNLGEFR